MNYDEFENKFIKENRMLKISLVVIMGIMALSVFIAYTSKVYFITRGGEIFKERLLLSDVCEKSFRSLTSGENHPFFLSSGIIEIVKKEPFLIDDYKVLKLSSMGEKFCQIIIKEGKTLRGFKAEFEQDSSSPFYFKLLNLEEFETNS